MYWETKKLQLIEEILKIEDDAVLAEVETIITESRLHPIKRRSFKDISGIISNEEVTLLEKTIEEGCEIINPNDWR